MEVADLELVDPYAAAFQVGARNMQNFRLLAALGHTRKPVILKRGLAAKVEDLLNAAEYILAEGNPNVILCERPWPSRRRRAAPTASSSRCTPIRPRRCPTDRSRSTPTSSWA